VAIAMTISVAEPDTAALLVHVFEERARAQPDALAYAVYPRGARAPAHRTTWGELHRDARGLAAAMLSCGVERGDRIAVHSGNSPLWPAVDLAIGLVGAVGVGIYPSSAPAQTQAMLADARPRIVFTGSAQAHGDVAAARAALAATFDIVAPGETAGDWHAWREAGITALASPAFSTALAARTASVCADDIAALIYTSGSTGEPKGAQISHGCLAASASSIASVLGLTPSDSMVSFLPFSHAAERIFGACTRIHVGMSSALVEDPADVFHVCRDFGPTVFGGLPRVFERMYEAAEIARAEGRDPRACIDERVGTRCRLATSGGAMLPIRVANALAELGLPVLGAYGQTEHLCVAMNHPGEPAPETVGPPMPGTEIRIAADGEVLVRRSALTFSGYFGKPEATAAAFTADGEWLQTGDLGQLDQQGRLRITGRAKEMIALSNGRKVAPLPIEAALTADPLIAHVACHGEGRKYLVALLSLRRDAVAAWARANGVSGDWKALTHAEALRADLQRAVDGVNATIARTDQIKAFGITDEEFTSENGCLTPTLKLMRRVINERFAARFEELHAH